MYLILLAGGTGQGKTHFLNEKFLHNTISPNTDNPNKSIYLLNSSSTRQYIFDVNNEYRFKPDGKNLQHMRHIDGDMKKFIERCKNISGFNIVVEDATGFLRGNIGEKFARLLTSKIHQKNNYIILFHSLNRIPPELMEMANFLILFKTNDNIEIVDRKFKNQKINLAFKELQRLPNRSFKQIKFIV